jgi:hypothetical protein
MKKLMMVLTICAMSMLLVGSVFAQATQNQTVTLAVNTIYLISVSGNPATMTISTGTAGTDALTGVTDASTTYSITQNYGPAVKITGYLNSALAAGYTLNLTLASAKGTSAGAVNISNALSGSAVNLVTAIATGADAAKTITYQFLANASAGTLASGSKTVTLTLTN